MDDQYNALIGAKVKVTPFGDDILKRSSVYVFGTDLFSPSNRDDHLTRRQSENSIALHTQKENVK